MGSTTKSSQQTSSQVQPWSPAIPYVDGSDGVLSHAEANYDQYGTMSPDEQSTVGQMGSLAQQQANDPAYAAAKAQAANMAGGGDSVQLSVPTAVQAQYINGAPTYDASTIDRGSVRDVQAPAVSASEIQSYESPYLNDVINNSLADIDKQQQQAQMQNDAQAVAAGAFGGSRHGVLGALTNQDYANTEAETSANLRNQGFQTALGAAQQDAQRQLAADTTNAGYDYSTAAANAAARNAASQFNAGQQLATSEFNVNTDSALNQFNRNLQLQDNSQALAAAAQNAGLEGQGLNMLNSAYGTQGGALAGELGAEEAPGNYAIDQLANYAGQVYPTAGFGKEETGTQNTTSTTDDPVGEISKLMQGLGGMGLKFLKPIP